MTPRPGLLASAVIVAVFVATPVSLLLAGLLLPGDPDDPNTKAFALGMVAVVPAWLAAAGVYVAVAHCIASDWEGRIRLVARIRTATPLAVAALMLLLAWKVAIATPAPETAEQAAGSPYLWRDGALRIVGVALTLLVISAVLSLPRKARSRDPMAMSRVEDRP